MSALVDAGLVAKGWLLTLGMLAAQGTVLALLALALTRVGKLRPAWQAAIWLVVALKFALPWGPAMPWSLSDLIARLTSTPHDAAPFVLTAGMTRVASTHAVWPAIGWLVLAAVWLLGASIVLVRTVRGHRRTALAARAAAPAPEAARKLMLSLSTTARVVVGTADIGPHVVGIRRPIIVVPPALLDDHGLLRAVLLHELAHVRRLDSLARMIQVSASTLLWWWPVVRLVHKKLELAREAACDAWALEAGGVARPAYARLLVRMASLHTHAHAHALAARHSLDARVAAVLGPPVRARMTHVNRLALAGFALVALGGARSATARGKTQVCVYTTQMAAALYGAFPDADLDGDGLLSRDEACDLQATLRKDPDERAFTSRLTAESEAELQTLLAEPLCCNCNEPADANPEMTTCTKAEGVER